MGFGLLFCGYLLLVQIPFGPGFSLAFAGYLLMTAALSKLKDYEAWFSYARFPAILLVPLTLAETAASFFPQLLPADFVTLLNLIDYGLTAVFHLLLLYAVVRILREVEQPKRAKTVTVLLFANLAYFVLAVVINRGLLTMSAKLFVVFDCGWNLLLLFNSLQIFHCYRSICPQGMENDDGFLPSAEGGSKPCK